MPDPKRKHKRIILKGDVPSPIDPPSGCRFHTRCIYARDLCSRKEPALSEIESRHMAACHFAGDVGV
jgi:peptide/nickel transport system ATP-binding protein